MKPKPHHPTERKSFRVNEFADRHGLSASFVYKLIAQGDLNARKANDATIITIEDEAAWLAGMPSVCASPEAAA
jgi:hypothetical protein